MFDKTKARINQELDDRVTAPVRMSVVLSASALVIAVLAILIAVNHADR